MRISDWSSDVCSSDLDLGGTRGQRSRSTLPIPVDVLDEKLHLGNLSHLARDDLIGEVTDARITDIGPTRIIDRDRMVRDHRLHEEIGRASCRERVCQYV